MKKFQMGTPECGLAMGILGVVIALLILFLGFWRTALVALLFALGYFVGAVPNRAKLSKTQLTRFFLPKMNN